MSETSEAFQKLKKKVKKVGYHSNQLTTRQTTRPIFFLTSRPLRY